MCNLVLIGGTDSATLFIHNPDMGISIATDRLNCDLTVQLLNGQFINLKLVVRILKTNICIYKFNNLFHTGLLDIRQS